MRNPYKLKLLSLYQRNRDLRVIRNYSNLNQKSRLLNLSSGPKSPHAVPNRHFVGAVVRTALKLRYWVATGLIGGGVAANNWYEEWKKSLPSLELPEWAKFSENPMLKMSKKYDDFKAKWEQADHKSLTDWVDKLKAIEESFKRKPQAAVDVDAGANPESGSTPFGDSAVLMSLFGASEAGKKMDRDQIMEMLKQKELQLEQMEKDNKRLEKENKILRKLKDAGAQKRLKNLRKPLIDMYSEVLDLLNDYDVSYNVADNLPRVVVVGDQSAGKTSVLEMIAQARIFPRGAGEMMTRAPVKVTLSSGPYHVAKFKDSTREFDLTKEADLQQLRHEIEVRMRNSVGNGKTVSYEVISLSVQGPSLPRMVLVDLPGVISTVTADMARETKDDIIKMSKQHMENPNAIILCIQDGSVDAERSNVTDLVSSIDPKGERTIMVLTKVDLAEENLRDPGRIKRILEGKLFPMKAIGYFGVVTGKGGSQESIESIRKYEEDFFARSQLLRDGVLKASQLTTRNMSHAVSKRFWQMVKDSVETQADAFTAVRSNLEIEWKNNFRNIREQDRDELYDKAKGEILDQIVNLSHMEAEEWEERLRKTLWSNLQGHVIDQVLVPAATSNSPQSFNTIVDIKINDWINKSLAKESVAAGWQVLADVFKNKIDSENSDDIFHKLKHAVWEAAMHEHKWDSKALDYLRASQHSAMEDHVVSDRNSWENACTFMSTTVEERVNEIRNQIHQFAGPTFWTRWTSWTSSTPENWMNANIQQELYSILKDAPEHKQRLLDDDITVVRRNLESKGVCDVTTEAIKSQWRLIYKEHFLTKMLGTSRDCQGYYQHYKQGFNDSDLDCSSVILYYRIEKMLKSTSNSLRQQITNTENRRLEQEIKGILDDWSEDEEKKKELLTGKRVELAQELKQVRLIQEKLEEFMKELQKEKS
ncbi:hypothetical protein L596_020470 [Steinernema carpocapsae]|uniref:Dynamin-like GTPase OPA1, mitochondrial n=1 Tax=Steinernema carpocapsae TaxID=34508 RepID=A0A4U5MTM6_STECR|nr:hypothetical protein L596_020470 [Steinernema carpocapsae]